MIGSGHNSSKASPSWSSRNIGTGNKANIARQAASRHGNNRPSLAARTICQWTDSCSPVVVLRATRQGLLTTQPIIRHINPQQRTVTFSTRQACREPNGVRHFLAIPERAKSCLFLRHMC